MTNNGEHAADDGSLARSTGGAAARGAMLIALALVIGLVLMAFALDDQGSEITSSDSTPSDNDSDIVADGDADDDATDSDETVTTDDDGAVVVTEPTTDTTAAPATIPPFEPGEVRPPSEVNVLVANGTGGKGIAGSLADKLIADGYIAKAANAPSTAAGVIYYRQGYADDARAVATILGAPPDILTPAPGDGTIAVAAEAVADGRLSDANVIVIVGADNAVPSG